jgi:hypothetical protein
MADERADVSPMSATVTAATAACANSSPATIASRRKRTRRRTAERDHVPDDLFSSRERHIEWMSQGADDELAKERDGRGFGELHVRDLRSVGVERSSNAIRVAGGCDVAQCWRAAFCTPGRRVLHARAAERRARGDRNRDEQRQQQTGRGTPAEGQPATALAAFSAAPAARTVCSAAATPTIAAAESTRRIQPGPRATCTASTTLSAVSRKKSGSLSAEIDQAKRLGRNSSSPMPTSAGMPPSVFRTSR